MWNKKQKGFSLMETMIATSILLLIMAFSYEFIVTGFKTTTFTSEQETAIDHARRAMEIMVKEIRGANYSEQGSYALELADKHNFIFYSDINDDNRMEKVRYFLDGTELKRVVTLPGALYDYSGSSSTSTLAQYVNNQEDNIFVYYDSELNVTNQINEIRLINIHLKINVTPERAPNDYILESDVNMRNLKDNL
jgi:prepilin-type N-terminal cleavage/methylation domain-containing protein